MKNKDEFDYDLYERENTKDERDLRLIIISGISILITIIGTWLALIYLK
jgi:hypothetical protein